MTVAIDLAGGGSVLAWQTPDGIFFERFGADHDPVGTPVAVASGAADWVSAKPLADGGFSIVWDANSTSAAMAQDYNASGVAVGAPYSVAAPPIAPVGFTTLADAYTQSSSDSTNSSTIVLPDDGRVTASYSNASGSWLEQIQRYDGAGNPVGPTFSEQPGIAAGFGDNQVAALADGSYVAGLLHQANYTSEFDVERFAADGTHLGTTKVVALSFTGNYNYFPHIIAQSVTGLPDGGFVASWTAQNNAPPQIFAQEYNAAGAAVGPAQTLGAANGTAPEIDAFPGGIYTITWAAPGGEQSASFSAQGSPVAPGNNDTIETPVAHYALPLGPHEVILTGTALQTVTGNSLGDTFVSNDAGSTLVGGSGNDTLIAGHSADTLTGGGGAEVFVFKDVPWNAGHVTDFVSGTDKLDLNALLTAAGYTGSHPVADGYVTFASDGNGDTLVYFNSHQSAQSWPALITTLDHVAPSALGAADLGYPGGSDPVVGATGGDGTSGGGSPSSVDVADATYTVPGGVTDVVLTGSAAQHVAANNLGDTITSNDYGSTIIGGSGNDTLVAGNGADMLTGGSGADTFVFDAVPWNAGHIADFTPGTDKIDLSTILSAAGYSGSNPVADGWVSFVSDGHGGTLLYLDAHNPSDPWPSLITMLDNLAPAGLTAANVLGDPSADPAPPTGGGGNTDGSTTDAGTVATTAVNLTVPAGVTSFALTTNAPATVTANNLGDTITSNDAGSILIGGTGNDTLIAGHSSDTLTGGSGNDRFVFNVLPWNAGHITDFNPSADVLDLHGIFNGIGYTGSNPVADGYLTFVSDGAGTRVYVNTHSASDPWPTLVTTLDHVVASTLHAGDYIFA